MGLLSEFDTGQAFVVLSSAAVDQMDNFATTSVGVVMLLPVF